MRARPVRWPFLRVAVAEHSMPPALLPGDWLLARRTARVRPGQVVLAWHPPRPGLLLVKRAAWRADGGWWLASDNPRRGRDRQLPLRPGAGREDCGRVLGRYWPIRGPAIFSPAREDGAQDGAVLGH